MRKVLFAVLLLLAASVTNAKEYFQQQVNYSIDVKLDDIKHELHGFEQVEYINNSPDQLTFIYFHLWPNAYKHKKTALGKQLIQSGNVAFAFAKEADLGYIDSLDFKVNGEAVKVEADPEHIDICKIILNKPLAPGERLTITTPFHVKLPLGKFSRLGHIDQAYQVTQWYPKPAVYDRNGWNQMPYLNQGEFYSEYGTYDVKITLPKNYVVGSTGDLVNAQQELDWLDEKVEQTLAKNGQFDKKDLAYPKSSEELKTLHYHQENVHDFAWFADKRFHVLKGEVTLPNSKKNVTTWTMFTNAEAHLWLKSIEYMNDAIYYYSLWNGDYPYNHATAVDGALSAGGGMEYPNVTVIGTSGDAFTLEVVIVHEVGHNWFYGILGSNERIHPWMDEGLNSFNELRYIRQKYPDRKLLGSRAEKKSGKTFDFAHMKQKAQYELVHLLNARRNMDQPIELPAHEYSQLNYAGIVYSKTAIVFDYLRAYLGTAEFDKAMKSYYEEWKFRHPQPSDLRRSIETSIGKKMDWFFDDLIQTTKKVDFKITDVQTSEQGYPLVTIKNKGDVESPVHVCALKEGKMRASVWYDTKGSLNNEMTVGLPPGNYDKIVIDHLEEIPEVKRRNNYYDLNKSFHKIEPVKLQWLGALENPKKTQLYYTPIIGYNAHDGFMAGLAVYNHFAPQRKFEYTLAPMYGFKSGSIAGMGSMSQAFYLNSFTLRAGVSARTFSMGEVGNYLKTEEHSYYKIAPYLSFEFKNKNGASTKKKELILRDVMIQEWEEILYFDIIDVNKPVRKRNYSVFQATFNFQDSRPINPYSASMTVEAGEDYVKTFGSANHKFRYSKKRNKAIELRLFAGTFLDKTSPVNYRYMFGFSFPGGDFDYLYDDLFLGRFQRDGILSKQIVNRDGGFFHYTNTGRTTEWLTSLNLRAAVPGKLPLFVYANTGLSATSRGIVYETGAGVSVIPGVFEVMFPISLSTSSTLPYFEHVRFTLHLKRLNPFDFLKNFSI